jgi:hypothetical protein
MKSTTSMTFLDIPRRFYWEVTHATKAFLYGFAILTIGMVLGVVTGAVGAGPHARLWLASHVSCLMTGLDAIGVAAAWPHLQLGTRARRATFMLTAYGSWFSVLLFCIFAPAVGFPSRISTPELPPVGGWAQAIIGLSLVVVTLSAFASSALVLYGLRAPATERLDVVEPAPSN